MNPNSVTSLFRHKTQVGHCWVWIHGKLANVLCWMNLEITCMPDATRRTSAMDHHGACQSWSPHGNYPLPAILPMLPSDGNQFLPPSHPYLEPRVNQADGFNHRLWQQIEPPNCNELAQLVHRDRPGPLMLTHVNNVPVNFDHPLPMIVLSSQVNPTPSKTKKVASTKTPAKTPVQPSKLHAAGKGSKSGVGNHRDGGDSDEEIAKLTKAQIDASAVKTNMEDIKPENPRGLTEKDKLAAVQYIVAPEQWKEFRLMQSSIFIHVSCLFSSSEVLI